MDKILQSHQSKISNKTYYAKNLTDDPSDDFPKYFLWTMIVTYIINFFQVIIIIIITKRHLYKRQV